MSQLPSHTDTGPAPAEDRLVAPASKRRTWLLAVGAVALVALIVVLHLTGVIGGEGH